MVRESRRFGGIYFPSVVGEHLEDILPGSSNLAVFMKVKEPTEPVHRKVRFEVPDPRKFLAKLKRSYLRKKRP